MKVELRELEIADAQTSWKWRNNPEVWELTGRTFDNYVTLEMEEEWIKNVLTKEDEKRFAICVGEEREYVGNIQLTDIKDKEAEYHVFIGEPNYWGKGIGTKATELILTYAFKDLGLKKVYLWVKKENQAAIHVYEKSGFKVVREEGKQLLMEINNISNN